MSTPFESMTYKNIIPINQNRLYFGAPKCYTEKNLNSSNTRSSSSENAVSISVIIVIVVIVFMVAFILLFICISYSK